MTPNEKEVLLGDDPEIEIDIEEAEPPADNEFKNIARLAYQQIALEEAVAKAQEVLATAQDALDQVKKFDLPNALRMCRVEGFSLEGGGTVALVKETVAGITEANKAKAFAWLRENEHGDLIKNEVKVSFGKGEEDQAKKLEKFLEEEKRSFTRKTLVHPGTLKAFVKSILKKAPSEKKTPEQAIPHDIFGIYDVMYTEVNLPKKES